MNKIPLACNLAAIPPHQRATHQQITATLFADVQAMKAVAYGYAFRLPPTAWLTLADFIDKERLCCPFFTFIIELEAHHSAIWFHITVSGHAEAQAFIQAELGSYLAPTIAQQTGQTNGEQST